MMASWQLWLSSRPRRRTDTAAQPSVLTAGDNMLYEFTREADGRQTVKETHYMHKKMVRDGLSGPPLHIHLSQKETFSVEQGVLGVVQNGKEYAITKDDGPVSIEPGVRHKFWAHASGSEDLVFKVWVEPQDADFGFDESFMRNFSGYLRDCEREGMGPSLFQMLLFLYHSDMVLTPPFWMPIWFLVGLHHVLAYWVGAGILGYKASYPEYSADDKKTT